MTRKALSSNYGRGKTISLPSDTMKRIWSYSFCEVFKEGNVSPSLHVRTLEGTKLLELRLLRVFVQRPEKVLVKDEILISLLIMDFDIGVFGINAKGKV